MEIKYIGGKIKEVKEVHRDGVLIGIIEGYIATWDIDRGDFFGIRDQFKRGAFLDSIKEHKKKNRQIRFKDHHGRTVGGFPIDLVKEDERGLFAVGEINLEVQQGREAYSLAKQGVLTDFSIGFSIEESTLDEQTDLRTIEKAIVWEGSIVDEPMNPFANITDVKTLFTDDESLESVIEKVADYYYKSNPDLEKPEKVFFKSEDAQKFTKRDLENALRKSGAFSKSAAKFIVDKSNFTGPEDMVEYDHEARDEILKEIRNLSGSLNTKEAD